MSWATCYSGSNNIHTGFPPLMSDGRFVKNFDPNCKANEDLKNQLNLKSNYDYRQYLINNGFNIIEKNFNNAKYQCGYHNLKNYNMKLSVNNKYIYKNINDSHTPYGYESSDLKNAYLSKRHLQNKLNTPILTQEELLKLRSKQ